MSFYNAQQNVHGHNACSLVPDPSGIPGLFLGASNCPGLPASLGGVHPNLSSAVTWVFDRLTKNSTFNANAAAFNAPGRDIETLRWSPDGTYAVALASDITGQYLLQATAATPGGVLGNVTPVAHPLGGDLWQSWPTPAVVQGTRVLFVSNRTAVDIGYFVHDLANSRLVGPLTVVSSVAGTPGYNFLTSTGPLYGSDGEVKALLSCLKTGAATSQWAWQGDLDPATPPGFMSQNPPFYYLQSPTEAGGTVFLDAGIVGLGCVEYDVVGLLGDTLRASQPDTLDLVAFAPLRLAGPQDLTLFLVSRAYGNATIIPGILNSLGLDPQAGLFLLGIAMHSRTSGRGVLSLSVPPLPAGVVPLQGLTLLGDGRACFTSTAAVQVR